jgi:hypothetical protein
MSLAIFFLSTMPEEFPEWSSGEVLVPQREVRLPPRSPLGEVHHLWGCSLGSTHQQFVYPPREENIEDYPPWMSSTYPLGIFLGSRGDTMITIIITITSTTFGLCTSTGIICYVVAMCTQVTRYCVQRVQTYPDVPDDLLLVDISSFSPPFTICGM